MCQHCQHQTPLQLKPEFEVLLQETADFETKPSRPMVSPLKVSCAKTNKSHPLFKAIGTSDPVGSLEAICRRAVAMLDSSLSELSSIRKKVQGGAPLGWPLLSDQLAWALENRMLMKVSDRTAWTGTGRRSAAQIIRWLTNIRNLIASGDLWYTCLDATRCKPSTWAWVYLGRYRVYLCRRFWNAKAGVDAKTHFEFQAQTIIHEVSHIYYNTEDKGMGPGAAECISQFVADANGSPIDPDFAHRCGTPGPGVKEMEGSFFAARV